MNVTEFKQRFLPCTDKLYKVAFLLTKSHDQAEDLVQETYLRVWTQRHSLAGVTNNEGYLIGVLRHIFLDQLRKKKEIIGLPSAVEAVMQSDTDVIQTVMSRDECAILRLLIAKLPDPQGKIMLMRDVEGVSYQDISVQTGLTEVNIRAILSRARKKIREQFKQRYDE